MIAHLLVVLASIATFTLAQGDCNPLTTVSCPPVKGLNATSFSVDFTQQTSLPAGWVLANYANVTFGSDGAKFWFSQRGNAPYIWTDFHLAYGTVDVELMISNGTGIVTSSVLFSDDLDEIDWEFSGSNFASSSGKAFTNYFGKGITGSYDRGLNLDVSKPQQTFHTYSFDWTPQTLTWLIDGVQKRTMANTGVNTGAYQYPQTPSRLHIGLWDAGDPNTYPGTVNWAGGYTNYSNLPYVAILKSVKITTPYPCSSWQYPNNFSGKWADVQCTNQTIAVTTSSSAQPTTTSTTNTKCTATAYTVTGPDTGYAIAQKFGLDFSALNASNPTTNWLALVPNIVLKVPCNVTATTTSPGSSSVTPINSSGALSIVPVSGQIMTTTTASASSTMNSPTATVTPSASLTLTSSTTMATVLASSTTLSSTTIGTGSSVSSIAVTPTSSRSSSSGSTILTTTSSTPTRSPIPGWKYSSCVTDMVNPRSLNITAGITGSQVNNTACMSWCNANNYTLAGTEFSDECYCGLQIVNSSPATETDCSLQCKGATNDICGGPNRLSLYSKVGANSAHNASTTSSVTTFISPSTFMTVTTSSTTVSTTSSVSSSKSSSQLTKTTSSSSLNLTTSSITAILTPSLSTSSSTTSTVGKTPTSSTTFTGTTPIPTTKPSATSTLSPLSCTIDACLSLMQNRGSLASPFCSTYLNSTSSLQNSTRKITGQVVTANCGNSANSIISACQCLLSSTSQLTSSTTMFTSTTSSPIIPLPLQRVSARGGPAARNALWKMKRGEERLDDDEEE